ERNCGRAARSGTRAARAPRLLNFVNASVAAVPGVQRINVRGAFVIPISDINRPVRPNRAIHRPEPGIIGGQQFAAEMAFATGAVALEHVPIDRVGQQIARDVSAVELCWKSAALINDSAIRDMTAFETLVGNVIEV